MSTFLTSFWCCIWWFLAGVLLGWLLNRWLCKCSNKKDNKNSNTLSQNVYTPTVNKLADQPAPAANNQTVNQSAHKLQPVSVSSSSNNVGSTSQLIDLSAAKKAGFKLKNADDLTVVEGIGPKISALFNEAGIKTFAQLAVSTVPQMRQILDNGGARFRLANPSTWAQQAKLAANNNWTDLKKMQDALSNGIEKTI